jgi:hypothetical protein
VGAHLKKLRRAEGGAKIFGAFRVKNSDLTPKNHIFPILGGDNLRRISTMYVRGYLQGSENGRVVTIDFTLQQIINDHF